MVNIYLLDPSTWSWLVFDWTHEFAKLVRIQLIVWFIFLSSRRRWRISPTYVLCIYALLPIVPGLQNATAPARLDSFTDVIYVGSAVLFIFSILGLGQQETARAGNWYV